MEPGLAPVSGPSFLRLPIAQCSVFCHVQLANRIFVLFWRWGFLLCNLVLECTPGWIRTQQRSACLYSVEIKHFRDNSCVFTIIQIYELMPVLKPTWERDTT